MKSALERAVCAAGLLCLIQAVASAATPPPGWPSDASWVPLLKGGSPYTDVFRGGGPPNEPGVASGNVDIVGDASRPAGYWYADSNYLMFRMRLDAAPVFTSPGQTNSVWSVMFDLNHDNSIDYGLQLDGQFHELVEFVSASVGGPDWTVPGPNSNVLLNTDQLWTGNDPPNAPFGPWTRVTTISEGAAGFGGNDDAFVDLAAPWDGLAAATGGKLVYGTLICVGLTTSSSHIVVNGDYPDPYSANLVAGSLADCFYTPEPATFVLAGLGMGLAGLVRRRFRKDKTAK